MSVEQRIEDMTSRDGSVEDTEKLSSDIAGHSGIPRRVEPPDLSFPAPFLFLSVIVVKRVDR